MYNYYTHLIQQELEEFQKGAYICSGMIGLLYYDIAIDLASHGSFQYEVAELFGMDVDSIAGHGSTQFECAERLIDSYTNRELFDKLKYYGILTYNANLDCYLPDFNSYDRLHREYYIEVEDDNGLTNFRNLKEIK